MTDLVARARGYGLVDSTEDTAILSQVHSDFAEWLGFQDGYAYAMASQRDRYHAVQRLKRGAG
jgi:hypothetical protein